MKNFFNNRFTKLGLFAGLLFGLVFADVALAGASGFTVSGAEKNLGHGIAGVSTILMDIALIAGVGFVMASFFKFHQHKLNPTQVPISQGATLLLIGAGLLLFNFMVPTAKNFVFGTTASIQHLNGTGMTAVIGTGA